MTANIEQFGFEFVMVARLKTSLNKCYYEYGGIVIRVDQPNYGNSVTVTIPTYDSIYYILVIQNVGVFKNIFSFYISKNRSCI